MIGKKRDDKNIDQQNSLREREGRNKRAILRKAVSGLGDGGGEDLIKVNVPTDGNAQVSGARGKLQVRPRTRPKKAWTTLGEEW